MVLLRFLNLAHALSSHCLSALAVTLLTTVMAAPALGQAPPNDACANAISVTVPGSGSTNYFAVDSRNGTASAPSPQCTSTSADDDVWYAFTANSPGLRVRYRDVSSFPADATGIGYSILDGCNGMEIACNYRFGNGEEGDEVVELFRPIVQGQTYYLRVFVQGAGGGAFSFGLQPAVVNDNCAGAIDITVQPESNCEFRRISTTVNTRSNSPATGCPRGGSNNDDEFYRFQSSQQFLSLNYESMVAEIGATNGLGYSIHDGCSGNELACDYSFGDGLSGIQVVDLGPTFRPNRNYYLRLYLQGSTSAGQFDFCMRETSCIPPNVRLQHDLSSCGSGGMKVRVQVLRMGSASELTVSNDGGAADLTFTSPGTQTTEAFAGEGSVEFEMTDSNQPSCSQVMRFEVHCPADNQTCGTATELNFTTSETCNNPTAVKNWYASESEYPVAATCNLFYGGDLFYSFTAPTAAIELDFTEVPQAPLCVIVHEENCEAGGAEMDSGSIRSPGQIRLENLVAGNRYTLRMYDGRNDDFGTAQFCARPINALPVELSSLQGVADEKANVLTWATAAEQGVAHFEIHRQADVGGDWSQLAQATADNLASGSQYQFEDLTPPALAFYRLRMVDLDGSYEWSHIISVRRQNDQGVSVYPNPASEFLTVDVPENSQRVHVRIMDLRGVRLDNLELKADGRINLSAYPSGALVLEITTEGRVWHQRVVHK